MSRFYLLWPSAGRFLRQTFNKGHGLAGGAQSAAMSTRWLAVALAVGTLAGSWVSPAWTP